MPSVTQIQNDLAKQRNIAEGSKEYEALADEAKETAYKQIITVCAIKLIMQDREFK